MQLSRAILKICAHEYFFIMPEMGAFTEVLSFTSDEGKAYEEAIIGGHSYLVGLYWLALQPAECVNFIAVPEKYRAVVLCLIKATFYVTMAYTMHDRERFILG
jgi:hypothetical protein